MGGATGTPPDLSIILVSWNTAGLLLDCLGALPAATAGLQVETIVVDNGSTDHTVAALREKFPAVQVIALGENRGFAGGNNAGLRVAGGRFVCLLNSDTLPRPGSLTALVEFLRARPAVGAVGPRLLNRDGSEQAVGFRFPTLAQIALDFFPLGGRFANTSLNGRYPAASRQQPFPIDFPLGACIVARREAVQATGLLDERYFMYSEEVDWCRRMQAAGWPIWCLPTAEIVHYGGQSVAQNVTPMYVELHRSRQRYYQQYHSPAFVCAARLLTKIAMIWQAMQAWRRQQRGELTRQERRALVRACGQIFRL